MDYLSRLTLSHQIHKTGMYSLAWCLYQAEGQIWDEESSSVPGTILTPCIPLSVTCCDSCLTFNTDPSAGNFTGYNSLHKESPASIFGTWLLLLCLMVLNCCLERESKQSIWQGRFLVRWVFSNCSKAPHKTSIAWFPYHERSGYFFIFKVEIILRRIIK